MTLPNIISLFRIIIIPVITILLIYRYFKTAIIAFIIAGLSDILDGLLARVFKKVSPIGSYLDPIADKLLINTSFIILSFLKIVPKWLTVIIISRDVIISLGVFLFLLISRPLEIKPSIISKATTVFQILSIYLSLINEGLFAINFIVKISFVLTAIFTVISGLHYTYKGIRIYNQ